MFNKEKLYTVYCHINKANGKKYIGITCKKPKNRWGKDGNNYCSYDTKFSRAIKKYGWDNFEHIILEKYLPFLQANEREKYYINLYDTYENGYNSTLGGDGAYGHECWLKGKSMPKEMKNKISKKLKTNCYWIGKKMTEEQKQKLKNGHKPNPILQYDLEGNFIMKYKNLQEIKNIYNYNPYNISRACKGKRKTAYKFIWKYEREVVKCQ